MEPATLVLVAEAALRVILGWRMLISGLSNVRRWPNPVNTAGILFPRGATFFGFVATFLMVVGGFGVAAGLQTPISALMIIIFLLPTFALHWHWLKVLPTMAPVVKNAIKDILGMVEFIQGGAHKVHYLRRPFQREPDFHVTSREGTELFSFFRSASLSRSRGRAARQFGARCRGVLLRRAGKHRLWRGQLDEGLGDQDFLSNGP